MDGENGFTPWDPFGPGCDPFFDNCGGIGGPPVVIAPPPQVVIVVQDDSAALGSVQNAVNRLVDTAKILSTIAGLLIQAITGIIALLKLLWNSWLKDLWQKFKDLLAKIQRILDKILKPIRDALKAQRDALMDIYRRFIRPLIVFIESIRRFIALLKLFHIHLLDKLDAQLAALERRIMEPFLRALGRVNTIGNWISFILNTRLLIFRNLFMRTLDANKGGSFNMLAGAPAYGMPLLPQFDPGAAGAAPKADDYHTASAAVAAAAPAMELRFTGSPAAELVTCWQAPIGNVDLTGALDELLTCLFP